jgi:hypothetical protein
MLCHHSHGLRRPPLKPPRWAPFLAHSLNRLTPGAASLDLIGASPLICYRAPLCPLAGARAPAAPFALLCQPRPPSGSLPQSSPQMESLGPLDQIPHLSRLVPPPALPDSSEDSCRPPQGPNCGLPDLPRGLTANRGYGCEHLDLSEGLIANRFFNHLGVFAESCKIHIKS